MKKCYCCGAEVPDQSKFCPKCGKSIAVTQDLIDRAKADDPDAQTELYERTYKTVYSRIRAKVPDTDTVMDIMQETYLRAFAGLDQLQNPEAFPSWLLSIASRQVCNWYRQNSKENESIQMSPSENENDDTFTDEDDLPEEPEYREDFSLDESPDKAETGRLLSEILDALPEDQRIILVMRYYDELSPEEISKELDLNLSTVKTRLAAARKKAEAKVQELEKSGTNLYSLSPISYLVFLLHHAEQFAPDVPADKIIGLTAAGAAGAGGTAAYAAADTAAKSTNTSVSRGVSAKIVAIIAAAVVVVGGGITAAVLLSQPSETAGTETSESAPTASVEITPDATPTEEDEVEPEPSEESEASAVSEEPSDEGQDQQAEEPAETEENQEEEPQEESIDLPSYDAVYDMTEPFSDWVPNVNFAGNAEPNSSVGKIYMNTNRAVELAVCAPIYNRLIDNTNISEDGINTALKKQFGSQYQLSDFTNTVTETGDYTSAFSTEYPSYFYFGRYLYRTEDGSFIMENLGMGVDRGTDSMLVKSIEPNGESACTATVEYDCSSGGWGNPTYTTYSIDVQYDLVPDAGAEYGWAITAITIGDEYNFEEHEW